MINLNFKLISLSVFFSIFSFTKLMAETQWNYDPLIHSRESHQKYNLFWDEFAEVSINERFVTCKDGRIANNIRKGINIADFRWPFNLEAVSTNSKFKETKDSIIRVNSYVFVPNWAKETSTFGPSYTSEFGHLYKTPFWQKDYPLITRLYRSLHIGDFDYEKKIWKSSEKIEGWKIYKGLIYESGKLKKSSLWKEKLSQHIQKDGYKPLKGGHKIIDLEHNFSYPNGFVAGSGSFDVIYSNKKMHILAVVGEDIWDYGFYISKGINKNIANMIYTNLNQRYLDYYNHPKDYENPLGPYNATNPWPLALCPDPSNENKNIVFRSIFPVGTYIVNDLGEETSKYIGVNLVEFEVKTNYRKAQESLPSF